MKPRSITIIDLAESLGLSKTTVADALKGSGRVAASTRKRVMEAAREYGYVSNRAARQLRTRTSGAIGLYIPPQVRSMWFYMPFAFGVAQEASQYENDLTLITPRDGAVAPAQQLDGVMIVDALPGDPVVRSLMELPVPIVTAGRNADIPDDRLAGSVTIEHKRMCGVVLDELERLGFSYPAFVSPVPGDPLSWSHQLHAGYKNWCRRRRLRPRAATTVPFPNNAELTATLDEVLQDPKVDAIFFAWQDIATRAEIQLEHLLQRTGRKVGIATMVSSMNDFSHTYDAVLNLRPYEFGQATARLLEDVITNPADTCIHRIHDAILVSSSDEEPTDVPVQVGGH